MFIHIVFIRLASDYQFNLMTNHRRPYVAEHIFAVLVSPDGQLGYENYTIIILPFIRIKYLLLQLLTFIFISGKQRHYLWFSILA